MVIFSKETVRLKGSKRKPNYNKVYYLKVSVMFTTFLRFAQKLFDIVCNLLIKLFQSYRYKDLNGLL